MTKRSALSNCIIQSIEKYFNDLNGEEASNLYDLFMSETERPFLETVMQHTDGNQSKAASILGINRNTLRKKLKDYNLS